MVVIKRIGLCLFLKIFVKKKVAFFGSLVAIGAASPIGPLYLGHTISNEETIPLLSLPVSLPD